MRNFQHLCPQYTSSWPQFRYSNRIFLPTSSSATPILRTHQCANSAPSFGCRHSAISQSRSTTKYRPPLETTIPLSAAMESPPIHSAATICRATPSHQTAKSTLNSGAPWQHPCCPVNWSALKTLYRAQPIN